MSTAVFESSAILVREFGGPEVLAVGKKELPSVPDASQVLIRVAAFGANPVDTYIRSGTHSVKPALPYTPGGDAAGVVTAVGPGVTSVKVGDRVYTSKTVTGSYGTYTVAPANHVHPLRDHFSFAEGAAIGTGYATAYRALFQLGKTRPGDVVFIHGGSGGVGLAALHLARWHGLVTVASAGNDAGLELLRSLGATHVVNHKSPTLVEDVMAASGGVGVDLVVEMLANENLSKDLKVLRSGGRVAVVGSRGEVSINPRDLMSREASVFGVMLFKATPKDFEEIQAGLERAFSLVPQKPIVGATFTGLASAPLAHTEVISRASGLPGRVVVVVEEEGAAGAAAGGAGAGEL